MIVVIYYAFLLVPLIYSGMAIAKNEQFKIFYICVLIDGFSQCILGQYASYLALAVYCGGFFVSYNELSKENYVVFAYEYNQIFLRFGLMLIETLVFCFARSHIFFCYIAYAISTMCILLALDKKYTLLDENEMFKKYYLPRLCETENESANELESVFSVLSIEEKNAFLSNYEKESNSSFCFVLEQKIFVIGSVLLFCFYFLMTIIMGG